MTICMEQMSGMEWMSTECMSERGAMLQLGRRRTLAPARSLTISIFGTGLSGAGVGGREWNQGETGFGSGLVGSGKRGYAYAGTDSKPTAPSTAIVVDDHATADAGHRPGYRRRRHKV